MDAVDRLSVAITGSHVRFSVTARESGIEPLVDIQLRRAIGTLDAASMPEATVRHWDFLQQLFTDFYELELSLECLNNIPIYLRRFPYRDLGVSRAAHLQYHLENWLNEVYLLQERHKTFSRHLQRAYRKHALSAEVEAATTSAIKVVAKGFSIARDARGDHVHSSRYVDREVLLLGSSESIVKHQPGAPFDPEAEFRRVRKMKAAEISELNSAVRKVLATALTPLADCLVVWEPPHAWIREPFPV